MPRMLFVVAAVLAAFVVGRASAPAAPAPAAPKVVVKTEKTVETVRVACPEREEVEAIEEDDPDAIDADQTEAIRLIAEESRRIATQGTTGAIRGVVSDQTTGERLAGVTITASAPNYEVETVTTDENGLYELRLAAGTYLVTLFYLDTTIEYSRIAVTSREVTQLDSRILTPPVQNIRFEDHFEGTDPDAPAPNDPSLGITFSSSELTDTVYYE